MPRAGPAPVPLGSLSATVTIRAPALDREVTVPVIADVRSLVFAVPSTVFVPDPGGDRQCVVHVRRSDGAAIGELAGMALPDGVRLAESRRIGAGGAISLFVLELPESLSSSPAEATLSFVDCPEVVRIKFLALRSEATPPVGDAPAALTP